MVLEEQEEAAALQEGAAEEERLQDPDQRVALGGQIKEEIRELVLRRVEGIQTPHLLTVASVVPVQAVSDSSPNIAKSIAHRSTFSRFENGKLWFSVDALVWTLQLRFS